MNIRCNSCMELFDEEYEICPNCGYEVDAPIENDTYLQPGTLLHDRYIVGQVLGSGGFGVTYLGWDGKLERKVAVKEYLPGEFSTRMAGQTKVSVFPGEKSEQFYDGKTSFMEEAQRLAKFSEQGIVTIIESFGENDTAYIVMEYLEGETLAQYLEREKTLPEDEALRIIRPILDSLQTVHASGLLHRDIAPDNIFMTKSGDYKLIDFGASRYASTSHSRSLTVIIKQGYSAEEQYRSRGDQGPHTDVYSIAATLYTMITGVRPPDALERRGKYENENKDILKAPHRLAKITPKTEVALLNALNVRIEDRTPDVPTFINELYRCNPAKRRQGKIKKLDFYCWPTWLKILLPSLVCCFLLITSLLLTGIISFSRFSDEIVIPEDVVIVPDVEGMDKEDALKAVEEAKLLSLTNGVVESEYIPAGIIVLQTPVGGTYANINGTVLLTISSGKAVESPVDGKATVPYVVWSTKEDAVSKLKLAGLGDPIIEEKHDENVDIGQVISQSVESGTQVDEGEIITIVVSLGPASFEMPGVIGQTITDAEKLLTDKGIIVVKNYREDSSVPADTVLEQSVQAGTDVKRGDRVTLTVASAQKTQKVENMVGMTRKEAENILKAQGFKVTVIENYDSEAPVGQVIDQSPEADTSLVVGSNVTLFVSKGKQPITVTMDGNGGASDKKSITVYNNEKYGKLPAATREGYTFIGWYTAKEGGVNVTSDTTVSGSSAHTLYACWDANSYTVTFDGNGGRVNGSNTLTVKYGSGYGKLPDADRDGYEFVGWFTAKTGGEEITSDTKLTKAADHKLYAVWSKEAAATEGTTRAPETQGTTATTTTTTATTTEATTEATTTKHEHSYGGWSDNGDGSHIRSCTCGETDTQSHSWDSGSEITPATHDAPGEKLFSCTKCSATKTDEIKALGHSYGSWMFDAMNDSGQHFRKCDCGDVQYESHVWDGNSCSVCGAAENGHAVHLFGGWSQLNDYQHTRSCSCGETETASHNWTENITVAPSCTQEGSATYTCADCGATKTGTLAMTEHDFNEWQWGVMSESSHGRTCRICGEYEWDWHYNYYGSAEYVDETQHKNVCSVCGYEWYNDHNWIDGTCTGCDAVQIE